MHRRRIAAAKAQKRAGELVYWATVSIQRIIRGRLGRKRFAAYNVYRQRELKRRQELEEQWREEEERKQKMRDAAAAAALAEAEAEAAKARALKEANEAAEKAAALKLRQVDEKLKKLEDMERQMREKEKAMEMAAQAAEEKAALMELRLKEFEERSKASADEAAARQEAMLQDVAAAINTVNNTNPAQLLPIAAGSAPNTNRRTPRSGRSKGGGDSTPKTPPSGRSARDPIPPNTPRIKVQGYDWVQLWDNEHSRTYWYCQQTQESQWERPQDTAKGLKYGAESPDNSGYNTDGSVMTDYTDVTYGTNDYTDYNSYSNYPEWQEYWDENAQAKYWYNNVTGEASWTKPDDLGDESSIAGSTVNPAAANGGAAADEWISCIDDTTGQEYWYNVRTGESSWA